MKIFYPVEVFYPSQAGGPANTLYWITKNLQKKGFQPIIVATDKGLQADIPRNKWLENDGGKIIFVKTRSFNFPFLAIIYSLLNFYRADIVHLSSIFFPTAFMTAFAATIFKKKIVWSPRGELDPQALQHSSFRKKPILWLIRQFIGKKPFFHSTCVEETLYIQNIFGTDARVTMIPNYIEVPPAVERTAENFLLYIGRIHPKKAIDNLIEALSISKEFLNSKLVLKIVGKGKKPFESDLRKLVDKLGLKEKIIFSGQLEGFEKQKAFADAFWTIMPSHTENFGIVVLESLAQSTPVIASKGTPWAILQEQKVGFWTENSPKNLARQIDDIMKMPEAVYASYRNGCRDFVETNFDINQNIDKWIEFYSKV